MPVGTRGSRKRGPEEDHVMLSEDGKNVVTQENSRAVSEQNSGENEVEEEQKSDPICSVDTVKSIWNFAFICSMLFLMIVAIRTFDVCV